MRIHGTSTLPDPGNGTHRLALDMLRAMGRFKGYAMKTFTRAVAGGDS
jgi:hypothetical protein